MITRTAPLRRVSSWQEQVRSGFRSPLQLLEHLSIKVDELPELDLHSNFPVKVPLAYANRMEAGNPKDPLLLQVLSLAIENIPTTGFSHDPVGDLDGTVSPGLIRKYKSRALLILTGACAGHCRYCFRRHFPYDQHQLTSTQLENALTEIQRDQNLDEVILSGGDPLMCSDGKLEEVIKALENIPQIKTLRIHTRLPVFIPERITPQLVALLNNTRLQCVIVFHFNHPQEIDQSVELAIQPLRQTETMLLNQAVLLKNINDTADTQTSLGKRLFACGILPYYLHQLDRVQGAAHYTVSDHEALSVIDHCRQQLPGYLVPRLVREISGEPSKVLLTTENSTN